jgi:hypothetical protein
MEYDILDLDTVLKYSETDNSFKNHDIEINITPEQYLDSITEEKLEKAEKFSMEMDEERAKAISEAFSYVVF